MQSIVAVVVGGVLGILACVGLVSTQSAAPAPVTSPYVTYDS